MTGTETGPCEPGRESAFVRLIESRFTGWICASIIGSWLAILIGHAFGYAGAPTEQHGNAAMYAFSIYVVKKAIERGSNGNGGGK